jgi:malate synthase
LKPFFEIPYYHDYISPSLAKKLLSESRSVDGVDGLKQVGESGGLEDRKSLDFLCKVYTKLKPNLGKVLNQRIVDRKFIDERVSACSEFNDQMGREISDGDYKTILGLEDGKGRVILGPLQNTYCRPAGKPIAPVPDFLKGPHVTLFGPPDSAKMSINAMNAYHRKLKNEPAIVEELLSRQDIVPKWGADDEDSKTPLRRDLISAGENLTNCFKQTIRIPGDEKYVLAKDHLALPIKRFPGLALPASFLFLHENPIPLHIYDFVLHLFHNWKNPQALVFYVPKLESEEEAGYIHKMVSTSESMIKDLHPEYVLGSVRLMIVLENPRAILRTHEIMDALYPYFVGASLGWHDYLGSTARLFKEDSHYRIPVKADPDIVIKYIKASHLLLADVVGSRGGIKVGGMYGILPQDPALDSPSFQMTLLGFIKDVLTQMKRDLTGFWVAHPDFVRLGIALVTAWNEHKSKKPEALKTLVTSLLAKEHHQEILSFISAQDIEGLDKDDSNYVRSLIVADIKESDFIANNHPDEIRYNVFQALQYLTDWLSGNGCVALPAIVRGVPVRVMDDLATAERSRWEVWHELYHGRFSKADFVRIVHEEMNFIRKDLSNQQKIVQVKWSEDSSRWYPVAQKIMLKLMTDAKPAEFATELLWPFTVDSIRNAKDPWAAIEAVDPGKLKLSPEIERLNYYFETCGSKRFAEAMAKNSFLDLQAVKNLIFSFTEEEIIEAASFHGDIGQTKKTLDAQAALEQSKVFAENEKVKEELKALGEEYKKKFGFKFLISAKEKSGSEILSVLKKRLTQAKIQETDEAKTALFEISQKRLQAHPIDSVNLQISDLLKKHKVIGSSVSVNQSNETQTLCFGDGISQNTRFQIASLSKSLASAFALEYFQNKNISIEQSVDSLFSQTKASFRIGNPDVKIKHLLSHSALNMHYVKGFDGKPPSAGEILLAPEKLGYEKIQTLGVPGKSFHYSGGGFLVLEHLLESLEGKSIDEDFLKFFEISRDSKKAQGYINDTKTNLEFPFFAAGVWSSTQEVAQFLKDLSSAFSSLKGSGRISHDTAVQMLFGQDFGSRDFMGADMGLGIFVVDAGENRFSLHQGSNEGFRALFMQCFSGPDSGKGFVICANSDNNAVAFVAEVAQLLLKELKVSGIDFEKFQSQFDYSKLAQEQIVNLGYKQLLLSAFNPTLPPPTVHAQTTQSLARFNLLGESKILTCSNQKFALAENLISPFDPVFDPELFCPQGKVMDSWETVRHNPNEFDWLNLELKNPSSFNYAWISTKFHDGNQVEFVELLGRKNEQEEWQIFLDKVRMDGHSEIKIKLKDKTEIYSQIQVRVYPDGGLTRLGLYQELPENEAEAFSEGAVCKRFEEKIGKTQKPLSISYQPDQKEIKNNLAKLKGKLDLASLAFGGKVIKVSNEHYGPAAQVISPFQPLHMFDGFESARSRKPGHFEEIVLELCEPSKISSLVFDFRYFVNNNPKAISIFGKKGNQWAELSPPVPVKAYAGNQKEIQVSSTEKFKELLVKVFPDGGIHRIHVY